MLVNDFTNVSKILHAFKNCENCVFFFLMFFLRNSDIFCDVCDCGLRWFGYEWGVSSGGFQSICYRYCRRNCTYVLRNDLHEFVLETLLASLYEEFLILSWDFTWEFFWDVMWNHVHSISISIYLYKHINWIYIIIGESTKEITLDLDFKSHCKAFTFEKERLDKFLGKWD